MKQIDIIMAKFFNIKTISLFYALWTAWSYYFLCPRYHYWRDLPSDNMFLLKMIAVYAIPAIIYIVYVVNNGLGWKFLQNKISRIIVVSAATVFVALSVFSLYKFYPNLYGWCDWLDSWDKYCVTYPYDYDLEKMIWGLYVSCIPLLALALTIFFKSLRTHKLKIKRQYMKTFVALGLIMCFLFIGHCVSLVFTGSFDANSFILYLVVASFFAAYLCILYLVFKDFYIKHPAYGWRKTEIWSQCFLWSSVFSLFTLSLLLFARIPGTECTLKPMVLFTFYFGELIAWGGIVCRYFL